MKREKWYNYLLGGLIILAILIALSASLYPAINILIQSSSTLKNFIGINLSFFPLIIAIIFVYIFYHKAVKPNIRYKQIIIGFIIWMIINFSSLIVSLLFDNESISYNFNAKQMLYFFLLSLIFTPIQICAEEFLFRGYLIGFLKSIKNNRLFLILGSSILFALPHLTNPEVKDQKFLFFLVYLSMAMLLGYLRVKYKGLEYSIGIHLANNFFAINFLNYPDSPLPSSPLFLLKIEVEPLESLMQIIIISILTVIIIQKIEKRSYNKKDRIVRN